MTEFLSNIEKINCDSEKIFKTLSDLSNLEKIKDLVSKDQIKDMTFDKDTVCFKSDKAGTISIKIIQREPYKTIKLKSEKSPISFTCWIQLVEKAKDDTRIKLTLRAEIPFMLKSMVKKPLAEGIIKAGEALAKIPYQNL